MKLKIIILLIISILPTKIILAQDRLFGETLEQKTARMQWFKDAKLGIFIHWGIYSVNGIDESWSFFNNYLSHEAYMKQLDGFTAAAYKPGDWAKLIRESGAKYAVLTAKHHDGVALWNTKMNDLSTVKKTPAGRDLVGPFCKALRREKLKVGLYFSHIDWSHPDYPAKTRTEKRYEKDSLRWKKFMQFHSGQLDELSKNYRPDLFWFDGDWEHSAEEWRASEIRKSLLSDNPGTILNSRLNGFGDYATPEQGVPISRPTNNWWELCMTINDSWGFQKNDTNFKTPYQIIRIFADCLHMGGNMLLDIGPKADGSIPARQVSVLRELGKWTKKHKEAIYGSGAGMPHGHFYGPSTLSADSTILYLFLPNKPTNGQVVLRGLKNKINRIRVVGEGTKLKSKVSGKMYWSAVPGILYIDVPNYVSDSYMTVIAIQLKGKIDLYREKGKVIESN